MSETQLERWGIERVAGATTVLAELVFLAVVLWIFLDDTTMLAASVVWVLVSAPVLYIGLTRSLREAT